jgi:hypothetical protein
MAKTPYDLSEQLHRIQVLKDEVLSIQLWNDCGPVAADGRFGTSTRLIDSRRIFRAEHAERWPQSNINDHSGNADENFLIPLWNYPSFFSRSSVDSSDVSLQHQG